VDVAHAPAGEPDLELDEAPALPFASYAVAFHLAAELGDGSNRAETDDAMESYERDMLLHAHRDEPPFRTHVLAVPAELRTIEVCFPPELVIRSEGRTILLRCNDARDGDRRRSVELAAAETVFERSRLAIITLVLTPRDGAGDDAELNEYDLIKLIKLWEGGEAMPVPGSRAEDAGPVTFAPADGARLSLEALAHGVCPGRRLLATSDAPTTRHAYRVGTVELTVPAVDWQEALFEDVAALKRRREAPDRATDRDRWDRVVALGGILQGLLDFRRINAGELADVFAEADVDTSSVVAFHKGTLLVVAGDDDEDELDEEPGDERSSPIEFDPYVAIPNVVLLHNEQRLKAARQVELRVAAHQPRRGEPRGHVIPIDATQDELDRVAALLAQSLPNIFHYPSERRLFKRGGHSRGFDDLEQYVRLRKDELTTLLQRRIRLRDRWTAAVAIIVGVFATVQAFVVQQAIENVPLWLVLGGALVLYLVFLQIRNRLF
jgi:hypothetical protein